MNGVKASLIPSKNAGSISKSKYIDIQNDVWIGSHVALKPGITISNGAVIATGAIVTKDVPPYAIVGGCPARVIKYRFEDEIIQRLLDIQWWQYSYVDFKDITGDIDIYEFLDYIEKSAKSGDLLPFIPNVVTVNDILQYQ